MASSSMGESNGVMVQGVRNTRCRCGKRARVKISESEENPNRLYAICDYNKCKYFVWLSPPATEENATIHEGTDTIEHSPPHLEKNRLLRRVPTYEWIVVWMVFMAIMVFLQLMMVSLNVLLKLVV